MRCKNCGWENPNHLEECEKCHGYLTSNTPGDTPSTQACARLRGTIAEAVIFDDAQISASSAKSCTRCGYPVSDTFVSCPNCNHELLTPPPPPPTPIQRNGMGTVMGGPLGGLATNRFCTLRPIAWAGEEVIYSPITFSGESIVLNRANTDQNNNSITSREQAVLTCENGEWFIENRSDLRTTFIRVNGKVKLVSGDIIVLGNREFEFKG